MKLKVKLIIHAIDYNNARKIFREVIGEMEIDYSKKAIDFAADLLYNITEIRASDWIKFALLSYDDDIKNQITTITYTCLIPYKELINGYQWN
jgi:hypothetical protein